MSAVVGVDFSEDFDVKLNVRRLNSYAIGLRYFGLFEILIRKMGVKMNFRIKNKNHRADPEIGYLTKSILKPYDRRTVISTA